MIAIETYHWKIDDMRKYVEKDDVTEAEEGWFKDTLTSIEKAFFPKPDDCFGEMCLKYDHARCNRGLCKVAVILCFPEIELGVNDSNGEENETNEEQHTDD